MIRPTYTKKLKNLLPHLALLLIFNFAIICTLAANDHSRNTWDPAKKKEPNYQNLDENQHRSVKSIVANFTHKLDKFLHRNNETLCQGLNSPISLDQENIASFQLNINQCGLNQKSPFDVELARTKLHVLASKGTPNAEKTLNELEAIFPPKDSTVPTIQKCCKTTRIGQSNKLQRFSKLDPYYSGDSDLSWKYSKNLTNKEFKYSPEIKMGSDKIIPYNIAYKIPQKIGNEDDARYQNRRKNELKSQLNRELTLAGEGSMSWAYFIHNKIPSEQELRNIYSNISPNFLALKYPKLKFEKALERHWVSENSKEVVKIRKPSPFGNGNQAAIGAARTDLAIQKVFEECANNFKEIDSAGNERTIIRVAPIASSAKEISGGVFRQRTVSGPTAYELAIQINKAVTEKNPATEKYLINSLGFKNLEDAMKKLSLLERFYAETHSDVIDFRDINTLTPMGAYVGVKREVVPTGFDYNHGLNVIWNPHDRVFDAIDF